MLALEWKGRAFIEKVNSTCFCWFPAAILVDQNGTPIWRLHTKLYKGAWNVSANNSETVGHKDLRFGQIVYILVFYNISHSWLLPLDGFQFIFLCAVFTVYCRHWKRRIPVKERESLPAGKVPNQRLVNSCLANSPFQCLYIHSYTHLKTSSALIFLTSVFWSINFQNNCSQLLHRMSLITRNAKEYRSMTVQ